MKRNWLKGMAAVVGLCTMTAWAGAQEGAIPSGASCDPATRNVNTRFVEMAFKDNCRRVPDPATFNYYVEVLNSGRESFAQVSKSIRLSCPAAQALDSHCHQVVGLSDLCASESN